MWPGATDTWPTANWRQCNGAGLSTSTYSDLFNVIGYTYGGSGGTFNLPNLQNRFVAGAGDTYNLNSTGGSADAIVVEHGHTGSTASAGSHSHSLNYTPIRDGGGICANRGDSGSCHNMSTGGGINNNGAHTHTVSVENTGSSGTNANLPPYIGLYYIIRIQ